MTVVLPNGTIEHLGGKIVKNSSGYSLKDLLIGSEGTLAIITELILKLVPLPEKSVSLLIPYAKMEDAIGAVPEIIRLKSSPTAIEFMEREVICFAEEFLGKNSRYKKSGIFIVDI